MKKSYFLFISLALNVLLVFQLSNDIKFERYYEYYINGNKYFKKSANPFRAEMFTKLPVEQGTIIFAGDSHVEHFELTELLNKNIKNRGIEGEDIVGMISRLQTVTVNKPVKIFLQLGINDLAYGDTKEKVLSNYAELIRLIKKDAPASKIYVNSLFPTEIALHNNIGYCNAKINEDVVFINKKLAKFEGIYFIDCYNNFSEGQQLKHELTTDGIHLNANGYVLWSGILKKHL